MYTGIMKHYEFQLVIADPNYTFDAMSADLEAIFTTLEDNPSVQSCDIAATTNFSAHFLIASEVLSIPEIEATLKEILGSRGYHEDHYVLVAPEGAS